MTETTKTIFAKYEIRKSKKQKSDFINWLKPVISQTGYNVSIEKGLLGARNIIIGNPNTAKVIYTAHYDTCAALPLPNFITPKIFLFYLLYQFTLVLLLSAFVFAATVVLYLLEIQNYLLVTDILLWAIIAGIMFGPANKHTANDNTSGVTTVLDIIQSLTPEDRNKAAFILFDLEESGLIGSLSYRLKHRKSLKQKVLINFDCVSDGNNILFVLKRKAKGYIPDIQDAFPSTDDFTVETAAHGVFYPSDQAMFPYGIGVAALKHTKFLKILYMNRIHTKRDTVYNENNIAFLVEGAIRLTKTL